MTVHQQLAAAVPAVRPAYREQVRRIAPPQLLDRGTELAELAGFCLDPQRGPYVWWQARPWAGKSALLSSFVLRPPEALAAGRVRVVPFFIIGRLAGQDTREAFTTVLLEQLCELTGQRQPHVAGEASREAVLLDLLSQAAASCQTDGGRLVLLVDGLDEDCGDTPGPAAHSIAALLPGDPPHGMRIIVAGRPNPPIPDDVPDWHPLRDPRIIRPLTDSPHARDIQRLAQTELKRLLRGSRIEQDLLGLLTAARGGLSGPDLRELTGAALVDIEDVLHGVAGRTFTRRANDWAPAGPEVYLLGHEELHHAARHYLGEHRLAAYRDRLHAWADGYRTARTDRPAWPPTTPTYLLSGYPRMLRATADSQRLLALATDQARHDRMLDLSGGDAAALAEIISCQDLILAHPEPDLLAMARLSKHRNELTDRNNIPIGLPAVWASLGHLARAEALAGGITAPGRLTQALVALARAVAAAGDIDRAEQIARTIADVFWQEQALADLTRIVAITDGGVDRAEQIARTITDLDHQDQALTDLARAAVTSAGGVDRAEQIARTITDPNQRVRALTELAEMVATAGEIGQAARLAAAAEQISPVGDPFLQGKERAALAAVVAAGGDISRAEQIACAIANRLPRVKALTAIARIAAAGGDIDRAARIAGSAEPIARTIPDPYRRASALAALAVSTGDIDRAMQIACTMTDRDWQEAALPGSAEKVAAAGGANGAEHDARAIADPLLQARAEMLAGLAEAVASVGATSEAARLTDSAEQTACTISSPYRRAQVLATLARAAAEAGDLVHATRLVDRAVQVADTITSPGGRGWMLAELVGAAVTSGSFVTAERIARLITEPDRRAEALTALAATAASAGETGEAARLADSAEQTARSFSDPHRQAHVLATLARAAAAAGDLGQAACLVDTAEQIANNITDPHWHARTLAELARAAVPAGDIKRVIHLTDAAEQVARTITDLEMQGHLLGELVTAVAAVGATGQAARLANCAEKAAHTVADPERQSEALASLAKALAAGGAFDRAEQIARTITRPDRHARVLAQLARTAAAAVDIEQAARLADIAEQVIRTISNPRRQESRLTDLCITVAAGRGIDRAEQMARTITDPDRQAEALTTLAEDAAAAGDIDRAEQITRTITNPGRPAVRLAALAGAVAAGEGIEQVQQLVDSVKQHVRGIAQPYEQAAAATALARAAAAAGHTDRARQIIQLIDLSHRQVEALLSVAEIADQTQTRHLIGEAFAVGPWHLPLAAMAKIEPGLVSQIAGTAMGCGPSGPALPF